MRGIAKAQQECPADMLVESSMSDALHDADNILSAVLSWQGQ